MSRIDDLIERLAPDGVMFRPLGELATIVRERIDGELLDRSNYVGVENLLPDFGGRRDAAPSVSVAGAIRFQPDDILLGNIRPYLKKAWHADRDGGASPDVLVISILPDRREQITPRFLYYLLTADVFIAYTMQHAKGAKMPRGDKRATLAYRVPVPPLKVQQEIVRILDTFTELEAELEAELDARRVQFAHYRSALLRQSRGARWTTLGELCTEVVNGGTPRSTRSEYYASGTIPWLRTQEVNYQDIYETSSAITAEGLANSSAKWVPANSVIIAISGAGVTRGRVAVNKVPLTTNQHCCSLVIDPALAHYRFVYHWLADHYEDLRSRGQGNRSDLTLGIVKGFPILVPPLERQIAVAGLLDRFETLVRNVSSGLPAEIEARRQQYAYYRDRLLTFKEAV